MAKLHFRQKGKWPTKISGPVIGEPNETWNAIDAALVQGLRGLAGGSSLARLLAEAGLKRHQKELPLLDLEQVLTWAEVDQRETGKWPIHNSGPVRAAPGETWAKIDWCLNRGTRGLPGRMTLAGLLRYHREILSRAWMLPVRDGNRLITTPVELTAVLMTRGPLQQPDLLYSIMARQRQFLEEAGGQSRRRGR